MERTISPRDSGTVSRHPDERRRWEEWAMLDTVRLWLLVVLGQFALAHDVQRMPQGRRGRRERANPAAHLMTKTLVEDQIRGLRGFPSEIMEGLQVADSDFARLRRVIEALEVRATLTVDDGERVNHAHRIVDNT
jgi:hypothetical protein